MLDDRSLNLAENALADGLKMELVDILELQYFQSALFDVLSESFEFCVKKSIIVDSEMFTEDLDQDNAIASSNQDQTMRLLQIQTALYRTICQSQIAENNADQQDLGVRGKTLYLSLLQYAFLPSPNTEFFKANNVVSLNMLVKHVFFE